MALIFCPECGNRISDRSLYCIHCGCPGKYYSDEPEIPKEMIKPIELKDNYNSGDIAAPKIAHMATDGLHFLLHFF